MSWARTALFRYTHFLSPLLLAFKCSWGMQRNSLYLSCRSITSQRSLQMPSGAAAKPLFPSPRLPWTLGLHLTRVVLTRWKIFKNHCFYNGNCTFCCWDGGVGRRPFLGGTKKTSTKIWSTTFPYPLKSEDDIFASPVLILMSKKPTFSKGKS